MTVTIWITNTWDPNIWLFWHFLSRFQKGTLTIWIPSTWNPNIWLLRHFFCPVFKWSDQLIWCTIQILNIWDNNKGIFCPVFRPPFKNQTNSQPDMLGPFQYQTCPVFRWLLSLIYNGYWNSGIDHRNRSKPRSSIQAKKRNSLRLTNYHTFLNELLTKCTVLK